MDQTERKALLLIVVRISKSLDNYRHQHTPDEIEEMHTLLENVEKTCMEDKKYAGRIIIRNVSRMVRSLLPLNKPQCETGSDDPNRWRRLAVSSLDMAVETLSDED